MEPSPAVEAPERPRARAAFWRARPVRAAEWSSDWRRQVARRARMAHAVHTPFASARTGLALHGLAAGRRHRPRRLHRRLHPPQPPNPPSIHAPVPNVPLRVLILVNGFKREKVRQADHRGREEGARQVSSKGKGRWVTENICAERF